MVIAPGADGTLGILPNHASLISLLDAGELRIKKGNTETDFIVFGGFIEVAYNRVIVLADTAQSVDDIDLHQAEQDYAHARERLQANQDVIAARRDRQRATVRLRAGRRQRQNGTARP
jgi:F-type H+-transporting ATPase subunit epsilon